MAIKRENVILLVILALALIYMAFQGLFSARNLTKTVEINDSGFQPSTLTIVKGTTVTWTNTGERAHWPASNSHPTHTLYPGGGGCIGSKLDACRGLARGESFSFKFDEVGTWPMHDHLFPGYVMVVEVVEKASDINKFSEKFDLKSTTPESFRNMNYGNQLSLIKEFAETDPAGAWEFLKKSFVVNGQVVGSAHEFAHIIGNTLYKKQGLKGIRVCDTTFAYGCMHGVTEEMLVKEGVGKVKAIQDQCLKYFPPEKSNYYTGCIHGMGHGLYTFDGADLKQALLDCDNLDGKYRNFCYDGVFMENSSNPQANSFDPKDPWKLCANIDVQYHQPCAKYQSQIFLQDPAHNSIEAVGGNCVLGPTALLKETCFQSLGYFVAQRGLGNTEKILAECGKIKNESGKEICIRGAAVESIFQTYENYKSTGYDLCSRLSTEQKRCLSDVEYQLKENDKRN